ncbi:sensor histidine kinase [Actinotalea sp.]|uniref:sensor histidine kinase n=1 Tax=Actinotalea sp. TaxID=1872145 RepID=UPI003561F547
MSRESGEPRLGRVVQNALLALWQEPRVPVPVVPGRTARLELVAIALLAVAAPVEGLSRTAVPWPLYSIGLAVVCILALLWRVQRPLVAVVIGFGAQTLAGLGPAVVGREYGVLNVTACVLVLTYSLARWASARDTAAGLAFVVSCHLLREPFYGSSPASMAVGLGFLLFPAALGAAVRFWTSNRQRAVEQLRSAEREHLARDLHDTVAHHVSAILLQSQAGRAVAATDAERALGVLPAIEDSASKALAEMRALVGVLRSGAPAERAPAQGLADLERLVASTDGVPPVELSVDGPVADCPGALQSAAYRLVQECLTNVRRHASGATRVQVVVQLTRAELQVSVVDDGTGQVPVPRTGGTGYGLVGMRERMDLLGGTVEAGPGQDGGWAVRAVLPRSREPR